MLFFGSLAAIVWFSATVELGSRTLLEHLFAIGRTPEARALAEGTRDEAGRVADRVRQALHHDEARPLPPMASAPPSVPSPAAAPKDKLDDHDRARLDRLVREKSR